MNDSLMWYRFKTKADDYRPLIDMRDIKMPWWCTGYTTDDAAIIVCYLPKDEDLFKYWDDAYDIDCEEREEIVYTDRFRKPIWLEDDSE